MKKLLLPLLLILSLASEAQRYSELPPYLGASDSLWVPAVIEVNGAYSTRRVYGRDLFKNVLDSLNVAINGKISGATTINGYPISSDITLTAEDFNLQYVNNTSDMDKPISTAVQEALNAKQDTGTGGGGSTDAGDLITGTLADARLSTNVPLLDQANVFTAENEFQTIKTDTTYIDGVPLWKDGGELLRVGTTGGSGFRITYLQANFVNGGNNAQILLGGNGVDISRNLTGSQSSLSVRNLNPSATGPIQDWESSIGVVATMSREGNFSTTGKLIAPNTPRSSTVADSTAYINSSGELEQRPLPESGDTLNLADSTKVFSKKNAGRNMGAQLSPTSYSYEYQPSIFGRKVSWWASSGAGGESYIMGRRNVMGAVTGGAMDAGGTFPQSIVRSGCATTATAGTSNALRNAQTQWFRGNSGKGGFFYSCSFGIGAHTATSRAFVGFQGQTGIFANEDPDQRVNLIGFGNNSADSNWSFMHNDGSGVATKIDLGSSFPAKTSETDWYEARIYAPSGSDTVYYSLLRVNTSDFIEGYATTNLPSQTTLLSDHHWINNGTTAAIATIQMATIYTETQY